jgi:hypothetical protein
MENRGTHIWLRHVAVCVAMVAVMLRALIPAGFMLAPTGDAQAGGIPIVLCTEQGHITAVVTGDGSIIEPDAAGGDGPSDQDRGVDSYDSCLFAHAQTGASLPQAPRVDQTRAAIPDTAVNQFVADLVPWRGLAAPPPPATAPPSLI